MYKIIKILLCGNETDCSIASLLFNLLKDKKTTNNTDFITNIIYDQLSSHSQIRLSNSVFDPKKEIDKIKNISTNDLDMKNQILLSSDMPDYIKKICLEKLEELKTSNNETYKIKMYINILIKYPWISQNDDSLFKLLMDDKAKIKDFLTNIKNKMDGNIYGHKNTKTKIIQMMGKLISVQGSNINPIALVGPPGIGKTKFAKILSECLNIPFVQITLGGQNDGELLHGHGYTYSGSQPGLIVKKMCEAGSARCIMYFDELDKCVSKNGQSNELMSILIHLTDAMTNSMFQDRFFQEITFPLNKVIFIFSFNDISKVDKILLDRLELIEINNYSLNDKILISNNYLLKQTFKETGFEENTVILSENILKKIIQEYTEESGVRELKRKLDNVLSTLNTDRLLQINMFENEKSYSIEEPLIITEEMVFDIFGKTKINLKMVSIEDKVGYGNGLFVSGDSGGVLDIQIERNNFKSDKFKLKITGNLKTVMSESIHYSFNIALSLITEDARILFYNKYPNGLFVHFPSSSEKDGPSAGGLICICFLSIILDIKIKNGHAMTGEIDLNYDIGSIGGVRNKVLGGIKHGINTIILPDGNKNDIEILIKDMPEIFGEKNKYFLVKNIYEVIKIIFVDYEHKKHLFSETF
jgi:ATP-dependent Lon protease